MRSATQIAFTFDPPTQYRKGVARPREAIEHVAQLLAKMLVRLCARGDCAVPEHKLLGHFEQHVCMDGDFLRAGLRRATRDRLIAREMVERTPWLFPRELREAELTVARRARQLAEGTTVIRSEHARWAKLSLLCCTDHYRALDLLQRLLTRVADTEYAPTILALGTVEATWFRLKLRRPVRDVAGWIRGWDCRQGGSPAHPETVEETSKMLFIVLEASRLGLESMAALMEAVPQQSALVLIGNPNEIPRWGHGQPFQDLVRTNVFQCIALKAASNAHVTAASPPARRTRRSALCWRLRRSAGLNA